MMKVENHQVSMNVFKAGLEKLLLRGEKCKEQMRFGQQRAHSVFLNYTLK